MNAQPTLYTSGIEIYMILRPAFGTDYVLLSRDSPQYGKIRNVPTDEGIKMQTSNADYNSLEKEKIFFFTQIDV